MAAMNQLSPTTNVNVSATNYHNLHQRLSVDDHTIRIPHPLITDDLFTCVDEHNFSNCQFVEYSHDLPLDDAFSILSMNVRSLSSHHIEVESFIHHLHQPDCILMNETWLNSGNADLYGFSSYFHIFKTRESKGGGGVSLFIREEYS